MTFTLKVPSMVCAWLCMLSPERTPDMRPPIAFLVMFSEPVTLPPSKLLVTRCRTLALWLASGLGWLRSVNAALSFPSFASRCRAMIGVISELLLVMACIVLISRLSEMLPSRQLCVLVPTLVMISRLLLKAARTTAGGRAFVRDSVRSMLSLDRPGTCTLSSMILGLIRGTCLTVLVLLVVLLMILTRLDSVSSECMFRCIRARLLIRNIWTTWKFFVVCGLIV